MTMAVKAPKTLNRASLLGQMVVDFGPPLVVFYGLRAAGVDQWWALLLSGVVPVVAVTVKFLRRRTVDFVALFILSVVAARVAGLDHGHRLPGLDLSLLRDGRRHRVGPYSVRPDGFLDQPAAATPTR